MTNTDEVPDENTAAPADEILDDDALAEASGGQTNNSVEIIYSSTFVPFNSSY